MDNWNIRMETANRSCGKCGARFFADAPQEFCSACLLETGLFTEEDLEAIDSESVPGLNSRPISQDNRTARPGRMLADFGDYELLEEMGRGGQGIVYRARQKSLNRTVALKIVGLGQWATKRHLKRFHLEAEAAASLDHPCIVPIYEIGEREGSCYFSMKLIDGGQLDEVIKRTPMSVRQAAELVAKVARTVHHTHEHGILHRDIKPGNILLDTKGEPHLTDFGLARLVESESTVTRTLEVLGTRSYMAPEQAAGNNSNLTSATDVYGLGTVFYQLLTGHPPFAGGTTYETIKSLLETEPRPPRLLNRKVDRDLSTICLKCLEKDPTCRYASALALAEDLGRWLKHEAIRARPVGPIVRGTKWVRRHPTMASLAACFVVVAAAAGWLVSKAQLLHRPITTGIAVLPFENLSDNKESLFFADGIQEDILTKLAKIGDLKVISRTSVMPYRGARNIRQIGNALGVSHVLEGSIQRAGSKVRVNAQLIDTRTDTHAWAEQYDRDVRDVFAIQNEISRRVVDALKIQMGTEAAQRLVKKPTQNPEAYDAYLLGRFELNKFTEDGFTRSLAHFQQAIALDPKFALAYASLADAYNTIGYWGCLAPEEAFPEARRAAEKALSIDPELAEAHGALGYVEFQYEWKFQEAEAEFKEAIRLNSNSVSARLRFFEYLFDFQRTQEAQEQLERARELDPLSIEIAFFFAAESFFARDFDHAIDQLQKTISMESNNAWAYHLLGALFYKKKMPV